MRHPQATLQVPKHPPSTNSRTNSQPSRRDAKANTIEAGQCRGTKSHSMVVAAASATTERNTYCHQLDHDGTKSTIAMAKELRHTYSLQRHLSHHGTAEWNTTPTIYTPEPYSWGSPTLPPSKQQKRKAIVGLADERKRKTCRLLFASVGIVKERESGELCSIIFHVMFKALSWSCEHVNFMVGKFWWGCKDVRRISSWFS
jgi:hypothetical protein